MESIYGYNSLKSYNQNSTEGGADPGALYVSKEMDSSYGGYCYIATTATEYNPGRLDSAFSCFSKLGYKILRSKDMYNWEECGYYQGFALGMTSQDEMWLNGVNWAPDLVYDEATKKYIMIFTARSYEGRDGDSYISSTAWTYDRMYIGYAISDTPVGPFHILSSEEYYSLLAKKNSDGSNVIIDGYLIAKDGSRLTTVNNKNEIENLNGDVIKTTDPTINFNSESARKHILDFPDNGVFPCIDSMLFKDDDGSYYMYFVNGISSKKGEYGDRYNINEIWGMKMKDIFTPDYSTLSLIAYPNYTSAKAYEQYVNVDGKNIRKVSVDPTKYILGDYINELNGTYSTVNEAPSMIKHDGRYYLTFAPCGTGNKYYAVNQAISDSPLTGFVKLEDYNPVIGIVHTDIEDICCTGHHSLLYIEDELWCVYHAKKDNSDPERVVAADRVNFVRLDGMDYDILIGNGPTTSYQPLASLSDGYRNIAKDADITINENGNVFSKKYLNDGVISIQPFTKDLEYTSSGDIELTIGFDKPRICNGLIIYNSATFENAFAIIDNLIIYNNDKIIKKFSDLNFDYKYVDIDNGVIRPGVGIITAFNDLSITKVTIKISKKYSNTTNTINISDICISGK